MRLCVSVCLSAIISSELHVRSSANSSCLLPMAVARPSSGGVVVLTTSGFMDDIIFAHNPWLFDTTDEGASVACSNIRL